MSRPLRLEFPGSLWHITARGNEKRCIFFDDDDRRHFIELLGEAVRRFHWILTAYVLMSNHYHAVVELTENSLSRGMKWLNGAYAQWLNLRHDRVGHLFQDRFKSFLIQKEKYFLEVLRYVVLNPVRAQIIARPEEYAWSSHRAILGQIEAPSWLAVDEVLGHFGQGRAAARAQYERFVEEGICSSRRPWDDLVGQIYLGNESWIEDIRDRVTRIPRPNDHPLQQRALGRPDMESILAAVASVADTDVDAIRERRGSVLRMAAAWIGCYEGLLTNSAIAAALRLRSDAQVTNLVWECDHQLALNPAIQEFVDVCLDTLSRKKLKIEDLTPTYDP
ncbi:MAG TPA: transposase [Thermoanaerobaculia bacterium]|jgi:REP element-mobilizing transposase RayT|nr:transposase [Thermoanaerobaculia bacterium]